VKRKPINLSFLASLSHLFYLRHRLFEFFCSPPSNPSGQLYARLLAAPLPDPTARTLHRRVGPSWTQLTDGFDHAQAGRWLSTLNDPNSKPLAAADAAQKPRKMLLPTMKAGQTGSDKRVGTQRTVGDGRIHEALRELSAGWVEKTNFLAAEEPTSNTAAYRASVGGMSHFNELSGKRSSCLTPKIRPCIRKC